MTQKIFRPFGLLLFALLPFFTACSNKAEQQDWPKVKQADFSRINLADFADHELDVPYFLFHFARVANAVVEEGEQRGFLDLKVNRNPSDNEPYNARIMEMQMALAYFYGTDRPWNPYQGDPAVRVRLEAMLDRWTRIQNTDGLFSEYSPTNWSLAPTNFGAMAAAQTLEILIASGQPLDREILDRARESLRRALMAIFTREDMRRHAQQWSNQFSGSYYAALIYLTLWPDDQLNAAFTDALAAAVAHDQSPIGFHYEQGGPDFGYTGVHDNNLGVALPHLRERPDLLKIIVDSDRAWNEWLAANYVPQPGLARATFLTNAGINTRTSHAIQHPRVRPLAEFVEPARAFARTKEERAGVMAEQRKNLANVWGGWGPLSLPSGYSYRPAFVYDAWRPLDTWQPTSEERNRRMAEFPHLASARFNRQLHDPFPLTVTTIRRPPYFAVFNSGQIRVPRQNYGLGLLWHERFGSALQSVAGTPWNWGTRPAGEGTEVYERNHLHATISAGGASIDPAVGAHDLPDGTVVAEYLLARQGEKRVTFNEASIRVEITHRDPFVETIPLVMPQNTEVEIDDGTLIARRIDGSSFTLQTSANGPRISLADPVPLAEGLVRRLATIEAKGSLSYELRFE